MHIGILADGAKRDPKFGTNVYIHSLIRGLIQSGQNVTLIYLDPPAENRFPGANVCSYRFLGLPFPNQSLADWRLLNVAGRFDVFHDPSGNYMPVGKTRAKKIVTVHSLGPLEAPQYFKKRHIQAWKDTKPQRVREADAVIIVSELEVERLLGWFPDLDKEKIHPIPLGVDLELFRPNVEGLDRPSANPYILYVGAIAPGKGLLDLIRAFSLIQDVIPHQLYLVGPRWLETDRVLTKIRAEGLQDRVVWQGPVSHQELPRYYANANLTVHISHYEACNGPVLEALACGCPVVTSDIPSLRCMYGDVTLQVKEGDPESIAEGILQILNDSSLRSRLSRKGLKYARTRTWNRTIEQTIQVYREVCESR